MWSCVPAEEQMAIVKATIASESDLLDLVRARADAGLAKATLTWNGRPRNWH